MSLQDNILKQYEELGRKGLIILQDLIERSNIPTIDKYLEDLNGVINSYKIPSNTPYTSEQKIYADRNFFARDPIEVARELIGAKIYLGNEERGRITETGAYKGHVSRKVTGLEYAPGELYIMVVQGGNTTLVINTERQEDASVITIRGLEVEGAQKRVAEVTSHLGLDKSYNNRLFSDAALAIELDSSITPTFISKRDAPNHKIKMPENCLGHYYLRPPT